MLNASKTKVQRGLCLKCASVFRANIQLLFKGFGLQSRHLQLWFVILILIRQRSRQLSLQTGSQEVQSSSAGTVSTEFRRLPPATTKLMFGVRTCLWARRCLLGAAGRRPKAFLAVSSFNMVSVSISKTRRMGITVPGNSAEVPCWCHRCSSHSDFFGAF